VIVGFIGFGEAGSSIAGGPAGAGVERIVTFDIASADPRLGATAAEVVEAIDAGRGACRQ
jgi:3-hydroxyisobutyrate dehydrogenase-like beta-hydroxyacid dehydrogenase